MQAGRMPVPCLSSPGAAASGLRQLRAVPRCQIACSSAALPSAAYGGAESKAAEGAQHVAAPGQEPRCAAASGAAPAVAAPLSPLDLIPAARLRALRRQGLELSDVIKLGRRGVGEGLVAQIHRRWNTSEVARLHCHGKEAVNMRETVARLEAETGGLAVHRAGGTVLLYRGDGWQAAAAAAAPRPPPEHP